MISQLYFSSTSFLPFSVNLFLNSPSSKSLIILSAISVESPTLQNNPVCPSFRKSGIPPTGVPIIGNPDAIASKNDTPKPSERDGRTKISAKDRQSGNKSFEISPKNSTSFFKFKFST